MHVRAHMICYVRVCAYVRALSECLFSKNTPNIYIYIIYILQPIYNREKTDMQISPLKPLNCGYLRWQGFSKIAEKVNGNQTWKKQ